MLNPAPGATCILAGCVVITHKSFCLFISENCTVLWAASNSHTECTRVLQKRSCSEEDNSSVYITRLHLPDGHQRGPESAKYPLALGLFCYFSVGLYLWSKIYECLRSSTHKRNTLVAVFLNLKFSKMVWFSVTFLMDRPRILKWAAFDSEKRWRFVTLSKILSIKVTL